MAQAFPYTYYACECYDDNTTSSAKRASQVPADAEEEEHNFDPRSPRSNYALYPLEHLLYCEDCQQTRCPRCVMEETLNWFCPACLFEVPSSVVKSDGNRCTRCCFSCPVCTASLVTNSLENADGPGPYILACPHCHWSTVDTGIDFEKPTGIHGQLARIANGGKPIPTQKERDKERERRRELEGGKRNSRHFLSPTEDSATGSAPQEDSETPSRDAIFSNLNAFYRSQIEAQTPSNPFATHDLNFSSPSAYSRILSLYSATSSKKQKRNKPAPMREAVTVLEGLTVHDPASDLAAIERLKKDGWGATLSCAQKLAQVNPYIRFDDELRPVATLLCTKRSKRCRSCRHILSKPESKITSTRYKIKVVALEHIPRISIRALQSPNTNPSMFGPSTVPSATPFNYNTLRPGIPTHFLLHLSNPLFDPIRVTLATSSTTPGKVQSRITILCPEFEVGANTDVWDDALSSSVPAIRRGSVMNPEGQIEAGKPWDQGRNWTSVVIEVIPGFLDSVAASAQSGGGGSGGAGGFGSGGFGSGSFSGGSFGAGGFGGTGDATPKPNSTADEDLDDDENVLEIPIFVRLEFEADATPDERGLADSRGSKGEKEKREEAFWVVLGAGRIAVA